MNYMVGTWVDTSGGAREEKYCTFNTGVNMPFSEHNTYTLKLNICGINILET